MAACDTAGEDLLQRLDTLLSSFAQPSNDARGALKQWNGARPDEFARVGVQHLSRAGKGPGEEYLARLLATNGLYMKYLLSTSVLNDSEAAAAARVLSAADRAFFSRLVNANEAQQRIDTINRTFDIVNALNRANIVVPWLQRMTRHRDPRVQSKASLMFCRLYANPQLVERQMSSPDPRVRANAIEALWHVNNLACRAILEMALADRHHRVALNAALGLYYLKPTDEHLIAFASHRNPEFRMAAAWAIGETHDQALRKHLEALAEDPDERVRAAARRAIEVSISKEN